MNYLLHILIVMQIYMIVSLALNQTVGYSGLLTLSQAVLYGTGAYLTSLFQLHGYSFAYALTLSIIINAAINGSIITLLAHRLKGLYFTLASIAVQLIFLAILRNWESVTGGTFGVPGIPRPQIFGFIFESPLEFLFLTFVFILATVSFFYWFTKTPVSKLIECARDDEMWLTVLGKTPSKYVFLSSAINIVFATIAGALFAGYNGFIDPSSFSIEESILLLSVIIIGGTGNLVGPLCGAIIYVTLPEALRFLEMPDAVAANLRMIMYAALLAAIVRLRPNGLFGRLEIRG